MSPRKSRLTLDRRLGLLLTLTTGGALLLAYLAGAVSEVRHNREDTLRQLSTLLDVTAINSRAALAFGDAKAGAETLAALQVQPAIVQATLRDASGRVLARHEQPHARLPPAWWPEGSLTLQRSVDFDGESLGSLEMVADLSR